MIKQAIKNITGDITEAELKAVLDMATLDIKANRYMFNKRTSLKEVIKITGICITVLRGST